MTRLVLVLSKPPATGHTMAVNEVWRRRKGVPYTATEAPMCKLVAGEQPVERAKREGLDLNEHIRGVIEDRACGYCGYLVCTEHCESDEPCERDWPGGKKGDPAASPIDTRYMTRAVENPAKWECGTPGCRWEARVLVPDDHRLPADKTQAYRAWLRHECGVTAPDFKVGDHVRIKGGWPGAREVVHVESGTHWLSGLGETAYRAEELEACTLHGAGPAEEKSETNSHGWTCVTCSTVKWFPTTEQAVAWGEGHGCDGKPTVAKRPFEVGDNVRWKIGKESGGAVLVARRTGIAWNWEGECADGSQLLCHESELEHAR